MNEQNSSQAMVPGGLALIGQGIKLYKALWKTLVLVQLIQLVFVLIIGSVFAALAVGLVVGGAVVLGALLAKANIVLIVLYGILGLVVGIPILALIAWPLVWVGVSAMQVIRASDAPIGFKEAFARARPQVWSVIWASFLAGLYVALPILLAFLVGAALGMVVPGVIHLLVGALLVLVAACAWVYYAVSFSFVMWAVVDEKARGAGALAFSRGLVRGRFWVVLGRLLVIVFVGLVLGIVLNIFLALVKYAFGTAGEGAASLLVNLFDLLVFGPVAAATLYSLYRVFVPKA